MKTTKQLPLFIYINADGDYIESSANIILEEKTASVAAYVMLSIDGQTASVYDEGDNLIAEINAEEEMHFNYSTYELESNYE